MKPFRIYEVVAGGLRKVNNWNNGFDTQEEAKTFLINLSNTKRFFKNRQFIIQQYFDPYKAKIVELIDT